MKVIYALFALCLVGVHAAIVAQPPVDYQVMIDDVLNEMGQIAKESAVALKQTVEDVVLAPFDQIEETVESIEALRADNAGCVIAEEKKIEVILDTLHDDVNTCGIVAARTSAEIMSDIRAATEQLVFGGIDIIMTYRKCQKHTNSILKKSCEARLTIKVTVYLVNARKSIKTIRKSTNERIPAVFTDGIACTTAATENAQKELNNVLANVHACIGII